MSSKQIISVFSAFLLCAATLFAGPPKNVFGTAEKKTSGDLAIELAGNAYVVKGKDGARIDKTDGLVKWTSADAMPTVFFRLEDPQKSVEIKIRARGRSTILVNVNGEKKQTFTVKLNSDDFKEYTVGKASFPKAGYQNIRFKGKNKAGDTFGEVSSVLIKGVGGHSNFVRDFDPYWGRRGPSVHMNYHLPKEKNIEYFYGEVVVPKGMDKVGTYYMVSGFGEGYFGIQVNSPTERRVLFSVWSPFETQDPKEIPEHLRVVELRRGKDVTIKDFGNEGAGGQSFLRYPWKAEENYGCLTRVRPDGNGNTEYTAYFHVPKERKWFLIASFRRPATSTWYKGAYSFLENFQPETGYQRREVFFTNLWVWDKNGKAYEITEADFSVDATGNAGVRLDYAGGLSDDKKSFFLKNCGFFNELTESGTPFERKSLGTKAAPIVNFKALDAL